MTTRMKRALSNNHAPDCAHVGCTTKVGYHSKVTNEAGELKFKFKRFCDVHRKTKKHVIDKMKTDRGCENKDLLYGFACTTTIIDSCQIDVHHIDGNHHNNAPENLQCLCKNCHALVTKREKHHLNTYKNVVALPSSLFEFV